MYRSKYDVSQYNMYVRMRYTDLFFCPMRVCVCNLYLDETRRGQIVTRDDTHHHKKKKKESSLSRLSYICVYICVCNVSI
jgi:hypothetical protein